MSKAAIAIACVCLLTLSGCGNTAYGLKKDGQEASHA
ncbi:entericidin, partial [Rhizobium ruizarguesonis]